VFTSLEDQRNVFRAETDELRNRICKCEDFTIPEIRKCKLLMEEKIDKTYVEQHFTH